MSAKEIGICCYLMRNLLIIARLIGQLTRILLNVFIVLLLLLPLVSPLTVYHFYLIFILLNLLILLLHNRDVHASVRREKIALHNEDYKLAANVHRRYVAFNEGDYIMVCARPEHFPKHAFKKLYARVVGPYRILRKLGLNAYLID